MDSSRSLPVAGVVNEPETISFTVPFPSGMASPPLTPLITSPLTSSLSAAMKRIGTSAPKTAFSTEIITPPSSPEPCFMGLQTVPTLSLDQPAQFNLLVLHGFSQCGGSIRIKTRKMIALITQSLTSIPGFLTTYPGGIKCLFPTGPLQLFPGDVADSESVEKESHCFGWWRILDTSSRYKELDSSFAFLASYIQEHGLIDGVVGFSQGASLSAMVASWCESASNPARRRALAEQRSPMTVPLPVGQGPLKFALCVSGFRATEEYYHGFYSPRIETPVINVSADLDIMVSEKMASDLASACANTWIVRHGGAHYVPAERETLSAIASLVKSAVYQPENDVAKRKEEIKLYVTEKEVFQEKTEKKGDQVRMRRSSLFLRQNRVLRWRRY